jgi:signal peptidase II
MHHAMRSSRETPALRILRTPSVPATAALIALAVFAIDQSTKVIVRGTLLPCGAGPCDLVHAGPFDIVNRTNTGAALSLGLGLGLWIGLPAISLLLLPVYGARLGRIEGARSWSVPLALGLAAGGAAGNFADRVLHGGVTDLIVPGGYVTFNVADVAAITGAIMSALLLVRNRASLAQSRPIRRMGLS